MLWVDKYRPKNLQELTYNPDVSRLLARLSSTRDCPHLLFYGPSGAGKKTRVLAFLRDLFGPGLEKTKVETRTISAPNSTSSATIHVLSSAYHLEMTPSDVGNKDKIVVQQLIKEVASSPPISKEEIPYKVVVLNDVHNLSRDAQAGLRRTMEKFSANCRLILITENLSKVIPPLRSRCVCIRVPAPSTKDIEGILTQVALSENIQVSDVTRAKFAKESERDPRRALLMLETARMQSVNVDSLSALPRPPWEATIIAIVDNMLREQTPKMVAEIRGYLYDILAVGIPGDLVLKTLARAVLAKVENNIWLECAEAASKFDASMRLGSKDIFHLEAFVARVMAHKKDMAIRNSQI